MGTGTKMARSFMLFIAVLCVAIFLPAGTFNYWQAWVLLAVYMGCTVAMIAYLRMTDAAALERRARGPLAEQSPLQRGIVIAVVICYFAVYVVAGLDHRFEWSSVPMAVVFIGDALFVAAFVLFVFVMRANAFAATNITVESGQPVATAGPYAIVRHPMYSGVVLVVGGIALALGSFWALLVLVPTAPLFIVRLLDEERFLRKNLPGYAQYLQTTRWRLVPGVF